MCVLARSLNGIKRGAHHSFRPHLAQVFFVAGMAQVLNQFFVYGWFIKRLGLVAFHRGAGVASVVLNMAVPLVAYLPLSDTGLFVASSVTVALLNCASYSVGFLDALGKASGHDAAM